MTNNHPSPSEIESYVSYELDEVENERIIAHLCECDSCLAAVDHLWKDRGQPKQNLDSTKMERRLIHYINRSNIIGGSIELGVKGFIVTVMGLLGPIINSNKKPPRKLK